MTPEVERYELREGPLYEFALRRREFLGLVVLLVAPAGEMAAQESGVGGRRRGGGAPADIGAWLHIAEDGSITVYTGKVEIGQNIRTSLAQGVAEELSVPIQSIRMVMADTDLTPFDMGTFGSLSTPQMSPQLRRAAAAARETLVGLAAEAWRVDRGELAARDGAVVHASGSRSAKFGELTKGRKLVEAIAADGAVKPPVGASVPKVNGRDMVTGRHQYASDLRLPGMRYGRVLRPPAFGATLEAVEAPAGVDVVRDGDFAGVTAADPVSAAQAVAGLKAQWKTPPAADINLFEHLKSTGQPRTVHAAGSVEPALAAAEVKLSQTYTVAYIAHAPLEPRAAVAQWEGGRLTVWTGTQRPFGVRDELARAFGLDAAKVRVVVPDMGSGYGGKHTGECAIECARLARAAGTPVKLVWTREEEFTWAYFRPAGVIEVAAAAGKDGLLTAWQFRNYNSGTSAIRSPYEAPHQKIEFCESKSPLRQGSYRALAATANTFARESAMDELAAALGADPLAFRLKNTKDARLRGVLEAAAEKFGWTGRNGGLAVGTEKNAYVSSFAEVSVEGGQVRVKRVVTAFECGAVVNPEHLKNQVEGAVVMGLGGALFEAVQFANGRVLNPKFRRIGCRASRTLRHSKPSWWTAGTCRRWARERRR